MPTNLSEYKKFSPPEQGTGATYAKAPLPVKETRSDSAAKISPATPQGYKGPAENAKGAYQTSTANISKLEPNF